MPSPARPGVGRYQAWVTFCWMGGRQTLCCCAVPAILGSQSSFPSLPLFRVLLWLSFESFPRLQLCLVERGRERQVSAGWDLRAAQTQHRAAGTASQESEKPHLSGQSTRKRALPAGGWGSSGLYIPFFPSSLPSGELQ